MISVWKGRCWRGLSGLAEGAGLSSSSHRLPLSQVEAMGIYRPPSFCQSAEARARFSPRPICRSRASSGLSLSHATAARFFAFPFG